MRELSSSPFPSKIDFFFVNASSSLDVPTKIMRQLTALSTVSTYRFDKSQQLLNTALERICPRKSGLPQNSSHPYVVL